MPNLAEELEDFLDQEFALEAPDQEQQQDKFIIDDMGKADWAVRKIIRLQQKNNEISSLAAERISKIETWEAKRIEENDNSIAYLTALVAPYAQSQLSGRKKTVKLPSGNISFKAKAPEYYIAGTKVNAENSRLLEHVKTSSPEFVKVKESVDWAEFKKSISIVNGAAVTSDGEILEFMQVVEHPDTVTVKERD